MAGQFGLNNATWDSASCVAFRWGATKVPCTKLTPAKIDIKTEKVPRIGEMLASVRTPGRAEIADMTVEMLLSDYEAQVMPRLPVHAGTFIPFQLTAEVGHVSVKGRWAVLFDGIRIVGEEGPEFDGSEKALIIKLTLSVMDRWTKGRDGIWRTLSLKPLASSQTVASLLF